MQQTGPSYLKIYHEKIKNTFEPFSETESKKIQIAKRIGIVIIAPLAYIALVFIKVANDLIFPSKTRSHRRNLTNRTRQNNSSFSCRRVDIDYTRLRPIKNLYRGGQEPMFYSYGGRD